MKKSNLKSQIKIGSLLIDDCKLIYRVLEVFKNVVVAEPYPNTGNLATEIMFFESMENERWQVIQVAKLSK